MENPYFHERLQEHILILQITDTDFLKRTRHIIEPFHFSTRPPEHVCKICYQYFDQYKEARALARETRANLTLQDNCTAKVIFAKNSAEAETLILTPRERPILMEHEK